MSDESSKLTFAGIVDWVGEAADFIQGGGSLNLKIDPYMKKVSITRGTSAASNIGTYVAIGLGLVGVVLLFKALG